MYEDYIMNNNSNNTYCYHIIIRLQNKYDNYLLICSHLYKYILIKYINILVIIYFLYKCIYLSIIIIIIIGSFCMNININSRIHTMLKKPVKISLKHLYNYNKHS